MRLARIVAAVASATAATLTGSLVAAQPVSAQDMRSPHSECWIFDDCYVSVAHVDDRR